MAVSTCIKCDGHSFELALVTPLGESSKLTMVQCANCGTPVGVLDTAIEAAFVYGSVAKGTDTAHSDIDLMVIGDELNYSELCSALQDVEAALDRKISPTFLSANDWRREVSDKGSFISKVNALPKIFVFGLEQDLQR